MLSREKSFKFVLVCYIRPPATSKFQLKVENSPANEFKTQNTRKILVIFFFEMRKNFKIKLRQNDKTNHTMLVKKLATFWLKKVLFDASFNKVKIERKK